MGVVNTTYTFAATDTITSSKMNNIIDDTTFTTDAITGTTLEVAAGKLKIRSAGITTNELGAGSVTSNAIADGTIVNADISASAAIDPSKLGTGAITATATVTTANIVDASVTAPKLNGAQAGTAPVYGCRAWVNFDGTTSANLGGAYSRTLTTVTVTASSHGLIVGNVVYLDFTGGTPTVAADGRYTVTEIVDANSFKVTTAVSGASSGGSVSLLRRAIRAAGNVSSVTYLNSGGQHFVNFAIPMPNANYAIAGFANYVNSAVAGLIAGNSTHVATEQGCEIFVANSTSGNSLATTLASVMFIG